MLPWRPGAEMVTTNLWGQGNTWRSHRDKGTFPYSVSNHGGTSGKAWICACYWVGAGLRRPVSDLSPQKRAYDKAAESAAASILLLGQLTWAGPLHNLPSLCPIPPSLPCLPQPWEASLMASSNTTKSLPTTSYRHWSPGLIQHQCNKPTAGVGVPYGTFYETQSQW